jgi:hypothetical protein
MELRISKSHVRQTKPQIKIDYDWDGKEANFVDMVLIFVKEWLFPRYEFLKDNGWDMMMIKIVCHRLYGRR